VSKLASELMPVPPPPPRKRPEGFGARVRAARSFAGLSQAALVGRINEQARAAIASPSTVKRVESDDPSVRGSFDAWIEAISEATGAPDWFLECGWGGALAKYGSHLGDCPAMEGWKDEDWPDGPECTCGFNAAVGRDTQDHGKAA